MVWVYKDPDALGEAAAGLIVKHAQSAVNTKGKFSLVLSGGSTPVKTYQRLAGPPYRDRFPWGYVDFFWGDERAVPSQDERNNAHMAREILLNHVPVSEEQIHPIPTQLSPAEAAREYEAEIRGYFAGEAPSFDMILLGLGENGHTASLFPNTPVLEERKRWVAEVYVAEQDLWRITMTAPLINQSDLVVFLLQGEAKSNIFKAILEGPYKPEELPAQLIKPQPGEIYWLVDQAASSRISKKV
jgi:6-phosphogluconolactonase